MPRPSIETARGWRARTMVDREGAPLGRIAHIYLDRVTGEPEWALVAAGAEGREVFVPLVDATEDDDRVRVPVERGLVLDAPAVRAGRELPEDDSARLHGHYGGAPPLRWGSARRIRGGLPARAREGAGRAAAAAPGGRRLLLAGGLASAVAAALVAGRARRRRAAGLPAALGRALGGLLAGPAEALDRRRRRRRWSALARATTAPLVAAGRELRRPAAAAGTAAQRAGRAVRPPAFPFRPRRRRRMAGNLKLLTGLAAGYVLGARAGRERYERIAAATRRLAGRPEVQQLAGKARGSLGAGLERAASSASDRLQQVRGEQGTATEPEPTAPQAVGSWSRESQAGEADSEKRGGAWPPAPAPSEGRRVRSRSNR